MTQAAVLAQMGSTNQTFRNRIINGAMMISQRATSASPTAGGYFTIDRWRFSQASSYASCRRIGAIHFEGSFFLKLLDIGWIVRWHF